MLTEPVSSHSRATSEASSAPCRDSELCYAYQPIVNIHTGRVLGYEALLRGWDHAGYDSIAHVFECAHQDGTLSDLHASLLQIAIEGLRSARVPSDAKLFYNLDNRVFEHGGPMVELEEFRAVSGFIYFELSEKHQMLGGMDPVSCIDALKRHRYRIAIDDFGSGYSGLQLLYHSEPELIKVDRFFIDGIQNDAKKKLFVSNVVNMAHIMGIMVVAEGVESAEEYHVCRDVGCDFVQGYLVQRPTQNTEELRDRYELVGRTGRADRRRQSSAPDLIDRHMLELTPVPLDAPLLDVLTAFRKNRNASFFPVVNDDREPVGILRERDFKSYVYSPYGISLLKNRAHRNQTAAFVSRAPVAEVHTRLDKILELYALVRDAEGVIITENGKYRGVLSARSLLQIVNERELAKARDQNPLSRLPGNTLIHEYVSTRLSSRSNDFAFVYFDIDNFKPFNDAYGFRHGDRVILLLADLLRKHQSREDVFVGHIGGDDFFMGIELGQIGLEELTARVCALLERFAGDVKAFYSRADLERGCIIAQDRSGSEGCFPLLTVSAAIVVVRRCAAVVDAESLGREISRLKRQAKRAEDGTATLVVD
jgi:EAL domain-containing protein (putative c-di-GMP-specific phosphodiesterase class I)/GGDEF domain-containing protein